MYNFDKVTNRRNTNSLKWEVGENELPMWVADMDFPTAPEVKAAIEDRAAHGVFGYSVIPEEWYGAYISWWQRRHSFLMEKDWLIFAAGVVPIISSVVRKLTTPGENVLIQTPVYNIFFNSIINNGRNVLEAPLAYRNGIYSVDFDELEKKLANPQTTMMILCNPHNPIGKLWEKETLEKIGELCAKYGVVVVSDEIHCDITEPGKSYVPFASVSEVCKMNSITCISPTKAFNLAGVQTAAAVVPNPQLRHKVWRALNTDEVAEPNVFAAEAAAAAFIKGEKRLDELCEYISENKSFAAEFIEREIPKLRLIQSDSTYLLWLSLEEIFGLSTEAARFIRSETGLYLSDGAEYGSCGKGFLRMNIACPRETLKDGLNRLKKGLDSYEKYLINQC